MKIMKNKKFTLIEVLVAIVIFSISSLGLYSTMMVARAAQVSAKNRLHAIKLVNEKLEELQQAPYEDLEQLALASTTEEEDISSNQLTTDLPDGTKDYSPKLNLFDGTIFTSYSSVDDTDGEEVCRIDCTVQWVDPSSELDRSVTSHIFVYNIEGK